MPAGHAGRVAVGRVAVGAEPGESGALGESGEERGGTEGEGPAMDSRLGVAPPALAAVGGGNE